MPLSKFFFCIKLNSWLVIPSLYMVIPFILGVFAGQYRQTLTYSPRERTHLYMSAAIKMCLFHCPFIPSRQEKSMKRENQSSVSEFLLRGLPIRPEQQGAFFTLFLAMYLTTVLGNLLILLLLSCLLGRKDSERSRNEQSGTSK